MKKLYTLALAAMTAVSAMAADIAPKAFTDLNVEVSAMTKAPAFKLNTPAIKRAKAQLPTAEEMVGPRVCISHEGEDYDNSLVEIAAGSEADTYLLKNLLFTGSNDVECFLGEGTFGDETVYDVLVIPGGGTVTLFTESGKSYKLFLFGYDESGNPGLYGDDIQLAVINGNIIMPYADCGIAYMTKGTQGYSGGWLLNPEMAVPNSMSAWVDLDLTQDPVVTTQSQTYEFSAYDEATSTLTVYNLFDFEKPVSFEVAEDGSCTATDQVVAVRTSGQWVFYGTEDFSNGGNTAVTGQIANNEDGTSTLTFNDSYWWAYNSAKNTYFAAGANSTTVFAFTFPNLNNSVGNVTVDANAPVEYFNLQGVRVQNPENGLFIRRQGNSVSKVVK